MFCFVWSAVSHVARCDECLVWCAVWCVVYVPVEKRLERWRVGGSPASWRSHRYYKRPVQHSTIIIMQKTRSYNHDSISLEAIVVIWKAAENHWYNDSCLPDSPECAKLYYNTSHSMSWHHVVLHHITWHPIIPQNITHITSLLSINAPDIHPHTYLCSQHSQPIIRNYPAPCLGLKHLLLLYLAHHIQHEGDGTITSSPHAETVR